jgi:Holliday junction resolvase RusA-like endonuclease
VRVGAMNKLSKPSTNFTTVPNGLLPRRGDKHEGEGLFPWQSSRTPLRGPVSVFLECVVTTPRSYTQTQRPAAALGVVPVIGVEDADNLAKSVLDALTTIGIWEDDKQVDELHVRKRYGERDEIHIGIELRGP